MPYRFIIRGKLSKIRCDKKKLLSLSKLPSCVMYFSRRVNIPNVGRMVRDKNVQKYFRMKMINHELLPWLKIIYLRVLFKIEAIL